jgi:hypothetical protein
MLLLSKDGHCRGTCPARALLLTVPELFAPNSFTSGARSQRVENARGDLHYNVLTALIASKVEGWRSSEARF